MNNSDGPRFWLEKAVEEINAARPEGELIVSSGASPSGTYHIGHLREFLTADAIAWGLRQIGREARHIHFVDDFDRFRKVPANVPAEFEKYLGMPLYMVPAPDGSDQSYAEYFFREIESAMSKMGAEMEVIFSHDRYNTGYFADAIEKTLGNVDGIRGIIENVSGRQLPKAWVPIQILGDDKVLGDWEYTGINTESKTVSYQNKDGQTGEVSYQEGRVKLDWRIDWPARWSLLPVAVEPFGRDHATKGGSYDTGSAIVKEVFGYEAPIPYPYEFINLKGETKKMSASAGTGILPLQALEVMPPAVLKDFVLGSRPNLQLFFDTGQGFGRYYDEFAKRESEFSPAEGSVDAMSLAKSGSEQRTTSGVPFNHMVVAIQSGRGDHEKALDILARSEHADLVETQSEQIKSAFELIQNWLETWAPEELKFEVQETLPEVELNDAQKALLADLAARIEANSDAGDGQWYHTQVHEAREASELPPKEAFQAIYRVLLGKDSGPKAGWFLSTFEPNWLVERFKAAA